MGIKHIVLASRPKGMPGKENFRIETVKLPEVRNGEVHLKGLYYSVDPYMRGRMNDAKSYVPPYQVGAPIEGGVVAEVVASKSEKYKPGDKVLGNLKWATEFVVPAKVVKLIDEALAPLTYFLGILGMPGLTAYFGILDIGKPNAGETVVISGAGGAVGIVAGQIAKIQGCRVIGIAGDDRKLRMLKEDLGFDAVINYKTSPDIAAEIADACPDKVDIYFDNVGGEISDAVIKHINFHARIALCGQIALYNTSEMPVGPRIQPILLTRSVLMQGFIVSNYHERFGEAMEKMSQWLKEGRLKYTETVKEGFENLPEAFLGLFKGENAGKMIVKA